MKHWAVFLFELNLKKVAKKFHQRFRTLNEIAKGCTLVVCMMGPSSTCQYSFEFFASVFIVKTSYECQKFESLYYINLKMKNKEQECPNSKRLWSKEEDELLKRIVGDRVDSPKWTYISQEFNEIIQKTTPPPHISRTNKQCRQRWQNHLNPLLKNHLPWSQEQHRTLFKLFKQNSHKWCELAAKLQSQGFQRRGENNIKNYFYTAIKRQIKRMNEIIRQNNKETKRKKSQINQYRKKYGYNPRLSLQRQILVLKANTTSSQLQPSPAPTNPSPAQGLPTFASFPENPQNYNSFLANQHTDSLASPGAQNGSIMSIDQQLNSNYNELSNLHIIKQLDYDLISKILLIAEDKGNKKYIISSSQTQQCHGVAQQLRNELIQLIIQRDQPLDKQKVRQLAIKMLKISRKCKRKILKSLDDIQQFNIEDSYSSSKKKATAQQQNKAIQNPEEMIKPNVQNQNVQIEKYFKMYQEPQNKLNLDFMKNSSQFKSDYPSIQLNLMPSVEFGRFQMDNRSLIDNSSQFLYNSNRSLRNYLDGLTPNLLCRMKSNDLMSNRSNQKDDFQFSQFFKNIKRVESKEQQLLKQGGLSSRNQVSQYLLPLCDLSLFPKEKKSNLQSQLISSLPAITQSGLERNDQASENEAAQFNMRWSNPTQFLDALSRRSSVENNQDEFQFIFPRSHFN